MNNISKLYTYSNTNRSLKLFECYLDKILNPMSKKLKFINDFDILSQDLLYTAMKFAGIKKYDYNKIDARELSYYIRISKGIGYFTKQNKTIRTKKNLVSYIVNNLANGNYYYTMGEIVTLGNVIVDIKWLVDFANFLVNSIKLEDLISDDRYTFIYKVLNSNKKQYFIYEYQVTKVKKCKIVYHEELYLYDVLSSIDDYDFNDCKTLNSVLNKEGYVLSINKIPLTNTRVNKEYLKSLSKDKVVDYLHGYFKISNRYDFVNRIKMIEIYELLRSLAHAYKDNYSPVTCRNIFKLKNSEELYLGYVFAKYYINYIYDLQPLQKDYHYNELNTSNLVVSLIDYRSNSYLATIKKIYNLSGRIDKQNNIVSKQREKKNIIKPNSFSSSSQKLFSLVKNKAILESKLSMYNEYNKGDKRYLINYLSDGIFGYKYKYVNNIIHFLIHDYNYNSVLFKLDIDVAKLLDFINDEDNLLNRVRFYQEGDDKNE